MKKNIVKIVTILMTIFTIFAVVPSSNVKVEAASGSGLVDKFNGSNSKTGKAFAKKTIGPVISALRIVGVGLGGTMIIYLGIQYMMAAPAEKAEIKNKLIPLVVGIVLVTSSIAVISIVRSIINNNVKYKKVSSEDKIEKKNICYYDNSYN